jgi:hypothetical protein
MFEQAFRNIDDVLRKEAGCTTELDGVAGAADLGTPEAIGAMFAGFQKYLYETGQV